MKWPSGYAMLPAPPIPASGSIYHQPEPENRIMDMKKVGPSPIESKVVETLLDLLSTDDVFRELFVRDASAALAQAGYVLPEGSTAHPGLCLDVERLASKENIVRDRAKLEKSLNAIHGFTAPTELRSDA